MRNKRLFWALALPALLAASLAAIISVHHVEIKTSLYDLVGKASEAVPEAVRRHSSNVVPIMVSSTNAAMAKVAADRFFSKIPSNECASIKYRFDANVFGEFIDACRKNGSGLLSDGDAKLLETPEGRRRIARAAARRYYSSPVAPFFSPQEDPFCLLEKFITSQPFSFSSWTPSDGVLTAEREGRFYILILLELEDSVANDADALIAFNEKLGASRAAVLSGDVDVQFCGAALHTAFAAGRCKKEIASLTWFSLVFIALLSLLVFRSLRWIVLLASSLCVSALSGAIALTALFDSVHMMTFVFGTTVLGLVIDYSFHWLLQPHDSRRKTVRNLLISFVTTEISLLPLAFSSLEILRQSSVFLAFGLVGALVYVLAAYPLSTDGQKALSSQAISFRYCGVVFSFLVLIGLLGLFKVRFETPASAVYRPEKELAETERIFSELSSLSDASKGFIVIGESDDLEELLEREESLGLSGKVPSLSRFMPSLNERRKNWENILKLYQEHASKQADLLGLKSLSSPPRPQPWHWKDIPSSASSFVYKNFLVVPSAPKPRACMPEGVKFCQPREMLQDILSLLSVETRKRLFVSFFFMSAALLVFMRSRAFVTILPSLISFLFVVGVLGLSGESVNLFHLLASFLLIGMGVDYTVFIHSEGRKALKPALSSLLTSVAGFGALAFVSFPVVNAFGFVLLIGLPAAFLCAVSTAPKDRSKTEHGASPIGLELLYVAYRIFGLRALHFAAGAVGFVLWLTSSAVRRASPSPLKIVAFTRSLADKLVVMAGGRSLPSVETDGSKDADDFLNDVASGKGVFVLSSHCGTIEVLAALGECNAVFHAWMEFSRTSVFNSFYLRHANRSKVVIHPISSFGPHTVFEAGDMLDSGQCLVMAGDRGFGRMQKVPFGSGEIELPEGSFRFARALGHNVYFVACVAIGGCRYRAIIRRLPNDDTSSMTRAYASVLEEVTHAYDKQWFKWETEA